MQRWIMHVDMDAFFASVEQFDNPDLMGLPVIVGGQSDRGVVSTCSYEARVYGVHSAMPMIEARRLCPQAVFLPGRMKRYQEVSRQIMNIFDSFSPLVEQLSVDEAFLDISGMELLAGSERDIGFKVKRSIKEKTGLTASVGIAPNKFLAKLASDMQKPDGLLVIRAEEAEGMLKPMSVRRIFGIGRSAEKSLLQFGIATIGQIADADLLISSPARAWEEISLEDRRKVFTAFVYPMIGLCGLSVFIGSLMKMGWDGPQSFQYAMTQCCAVAVSLFGGYFLAAYLINGLRVRMFMLDSDIPLAQQFAGYALVVVFMLRIVIGILPDFGIMALLLQFYIVYVVWEGSKKVMQIAEKDRLRFTILSSILLIACPVAIEWIFNKLTVVLN